MSKTDADGGLFGALPKTSGPTPSTKAIRCRRCQHLLHNPAERQAGEHKDCGR